MRTLVLCVFVRLWCWLNIFHFLKLKYTRFIISYLFQVYSRVIQYFAVIFHYRLLQYIRHNPLWYSVYPCRLLTIFKFEKKKINSWRSGDLAFSLGAAPWPVLGPLPPLAAEPQAVWGRVAMWTFAGPGIWVEWASSHSSRWLMFCATALLGDTPLSFPQGPSLWGWMKQSVLLASWFCGAWRSWADWGLSRHHRGSRLLWLLSGVHSLPSSFWRKTYPLWQNLVHPSP